MIGKTISHYKILEKLGAGGMGIVYKAQDTKLRRTVALKFLRAQALTDEKDKIRFLHEAQAAAALDHPNICTVYEVNETDEQTFIAMACIDGESLKQRLERGPLELGEALGIASQAAEGLKAAHASGIIHRDIKSANVMVTPAGQAKIMDFGLAKITETTRVTKTGTTVGTAAYMSPEQALGQEIDQRTDIWSLGVVLYELLAGQLPFKGDLDPALMYAIVHENPEPITTIIQSVPLEVERILDRALAKDPEKRYQSAEELVEALEELRESLDLLPKRSQMQLKLIRQRRRIAVGAAAAIVVVVLSILGLRYFGGTARAIDSIAVLPFEDLSGDPDQEIFAEGMTRELTATIGQVSGWEKVTSSRLMLTYRGTDKSPSDIANEVGVKALLAASMQSLPGDRVKAIVELIDGATEKLLWTQPFECESSEINNLYNDIARTTCEMVGIELTLSEDARLASARSVNPEAYDLYLRGRYYLDKWPKEGTEKAIEYFQQAIEIDPNYAKAYAMLAGSYSRLWHLGDLSLEEVRSRANPLLQKVFEIDDTLPEGHFIVAMSKHYFDWDWAGAEMGYKRAIALDPSLVFAHFNYAFLLMEMGRFEEAITEAKRALQLDPVSYITNKTLADVYTFSRQYDQAIEQWQQIIEMEPNDSRPHWGLAGAYGIMGRYEDAVRVIQKAMTLSDAPPEKVAALDSAYSESGPKGYWMLWLKRLEGRYDRYPLYYTAIYYAQLGDKDQAFVWLEKAYEKHDGGMIILKVDPSLDPLRDDPRFQDLLRRMNFPE